VLTGLDGATVTAHLGVGALLLGVLLFRFDWRSPIAQKKTRCAQARDAARGA
jgi:hypothetical protein